MNSEPSPVLRAVLFDLDGVLVDSFESWFAVVNEAAVHFGAPPVDRPRLAEVFGQGPEDDAIYLYPGQTADEVRTLYDELMPNEVARIRVGPESRAVLDDLERRGLLRAVVTNTQASLARQILETADLLGAPRRLGRGGRRTRGEAETRPAARASSIDSASRRRRPSWWATAATTKKRRRTPAPDSSSSTFAAVDRSPRP